MAVHRLIIDDFEEANFELFAIHTTLDDYRLAYFINKNFPILLSKNQNPFFSNSSTQKAYFSTYTFENNDKEEFWNLIENKTEIESETSNQDSNLFSNTNFSVSATQYFLPELKKPDYFLKIENPAFATSIITEKLNALNKITKAYIVDVQKLKSINNLISN